MHGPARAALVVAHSEDRVVGAVVISSPLSTWTLVASIAPLHSVHEQPVSTAPHCDVTTMRARAQAMNTSTTRMVFSRLTSAPQSRRRHAATPALVRCEPAW